VITGCTEQKILDHDNQQWDYKPMISKNNDIYGDTGRIEKSLPETFVLLGTIKEKVSQNEAMVHGKSYYISNTLPIGTSIYGNTPLDEIIYAKYNGALICYELIEQ
jgi:hypothetical protein